MWSILSPLELQRIPSKFPQNGLSRGNMGSEVEDIDQDSLGDSRRVFQDLQSLCPHHPKCTGMAKAEGAAGPESQPAGGVHLRGHLSTASISGPVQRTTTRIYSKTIMNHLEAGALGYPTLAGKSSPQHMAN